MTTDTESIAEHHDVKFRPATRSDGVALWALVRSTATLELNSAYFYLLFATDFGEHCLIAESGEETVGAIIGYRPPREPASAFVWQIGVVPAMQGYGLGLRMLRAWHALPANRDANCITATVATDNTASDRLFRALARELGTGIEVTEHFTADMFPAPHPPEPLYRIGPLTRSV
jgi:L-2,4-diaminobutyric acid acetyltransferase